MQKLEDRLLHCENISNRSLLSEPFQVLDPDSLLTVVSKIGMLATCSKEIDQTVGVSEKLYSGAALNNDLPSSEVAQVMDRAYRIVSDWPEQANALFSSLADRNPTPSQRHPVHAMFATRTGYRLLGRIKATDGSVIRVIDDALEDWLFHERGIYIDGRKRAKVSSEGDVAIDVADALRRLEGKNVSPVGITAWVHADLVEMEGRKVTLSSVEATMATLSQLPCSKFDDELSYEAWSTRFLYNEHYKRSDALKDIFSGRIRSQFSAYEKVSGLASLSICRKDFLRCMRDATNSAKAIERSPAQKAIRARQRDSFYRAGKVYAMLAELWPNRPLPDITEHPYVRCQVKTWRYSYRELRQRFYSIADALDLMEQRPS